MCYMGLIKWKVMFLTIPPKDGFALLFYLWHQHKGQNFENWSCQDTHYWSVQHSTKCVGSSHWRLVSWFYHMYVILKLPSLKNLWRISLCFDAFIVSFLFWFHNWKMILSSSSQCQMILAHYRRILFSLMIWT